MLFCSTRGLPDRISWGGSMRWRPTRFLSSVLLLGMFLSTDVSAQTTTSGGLGGVVTDLTYAVVPDANVEIKDNAKDITQSTKTDREGVYRFFFLAPGSYTLSVMHAGFREEMRTVNVLMGSPISVNVTLQIAKARMEITVTDEVPLIQAENGDVSATMNQRQISEVPNPGNDLTYVVQTSPGAIMNTEAELTGGGNFSILGMSGNSYLYTIDGMSYNESDNNLPRTGSLGLLLGQNQIQEATIVSSGYSGQFGGAAGGNINYVTKSGSNQFHGNAQYYWNGRVFNTNYWFNPAFGILDHPFDVANQWAVSAGGPVKRNKVFFFFDSEGLRLLLPQVLTATIPSPEFEAATIANIDSKFGPTSASDAFYRRIFNLYKAAPGARSAVPGGFAPGDLGCTGFSDSNTKLGISVPCAVHFATAVGRPSQDALTSGRVDWNVSRRDRAFLRLQYDGGRNAIYSDPINSAFDGDLNQSGWQGQVI